ncbi:MAG: putative bifunctional diguanylate cyclase/phosphodiesterase [Candidatus Sericytochromatia bacterium]
MSKILVTVPPSPLRQQILDVLHLGGFEAEVADSEAAGIGLAQHQPPELMILDFETQDLHPTEVEEILHSDIDTEQIPLLWLVDEGTYQLHLLGSDDSTRNYLLTPFRPDELIIKLHQLLPHVSSPRHVALASSAVISNVELPAHYYDSVTGLPNQVLLHQTLTQDVQNTPPEFLVGVLVLDLDRFRNINDALGHEKGDLLLKAISERLSHCVGSSDRVFHFGEDKFAVLLPDLIQEEDAAQIASDINTEIKQMLPFENHELHITASIGIALYPTDTREVKKLLRCAETAMYQAKEQGRNTYAFYSSFIRSRAYERLNLESGLHRALKQNEFRLYYQPKVDLRCNRVTGMEALLRWHHKDFGWVSPTQFIPLAEETDLILTIGEWALRKACEQNKAWQDAGYDPLCVTVNVSGQQFKRTDMVQLVLQVLDETGLAPEHLQLELTESVLMKNISNTVVKLGELKKRGVSIAVDDFGTGYSSLAYLKRFRLDTLKIDQSFVRDINHDSDDAAIVSAIINMAHSLGMDVVAEGVETWQQLDFLTQHRCDHIQGYYFSRPLPPEDFIGLVGQDLSAYFHPPETAEVGEEAPAS